MESDSDDIDSPSKPKKFCGTPEKKKKIRGDSNKIVSHRKQVFRNEWKNNPRYKNWLRAVNEDKYKAKCILCNKSFLAELSVVKRHNESKGHIENINLIGYKQPKMLDFSKVNIKPTLEKEIKRAEINLVGYLVSHNHSFNSADDLAVTCKKSFQDSEIAKKISQGRTKATAITISTCHENEIVNFLKNQKFSLIIDESTDIGNIKSLFVCVRFVDPVKPGINTIFWDLLEIYSSQDADAAAEGATADRLFTRIKNLFEKCGVPMENLIGFASDGCNVMFGKNNSVAQKLQEACPNIITVKCICHSIHICASEACKKLPRRCEDLARDIYSFFKNSSKRQAQLAEFQVFCNVEIHKILKPSQTRWLSVLEVVKRILEQWEPLKLFFQSRLFEERLMSVENIHVAMNDIFVKMTFYFLEWALPKFVHLNQYFQGDEVLITSIHEKMCATFKDLLCCYMEPEYVNKKNIQEINPEDTSKFLKIENIYLGVKILQALNSDQLKTCSVEKIIAFKTNCRNFMITGCKEILKRYDFSNPILPKLMWLNPKEALSSNVSRSPTLQPLMCLLPKIIKDEQFQIIDDQWRKMPLTKF